MRSILTIPHSWQRTDLIANTGSALGRLGACFTLCSVFSMAMADEQGELRKTTAQPAFRLSTETTYLLGPLDEKGYVDYVEAIRQRLKRDVTSENNAAVLLLQGWGPQAIPEDVDASRFWHELGIPPLPETGSYFVPDPQLEEWLEVRPSGKGNGSPLIGLAQEAVRVRSLARIRPWFREQIPPMAEWLARNDAPLNLAVRASRLEHYYFPIVDLQADEGYPHSSSMALLSGWRILRDACEALAIRAMLHLGEERLDQSRRDIAAMRRLAPFTGEDRALVHALIAITLNDFADRCEEALLSSDKLTPALLEQIQNDRKQLSPLVDIGAALTFGERCFVLAEVTHMAQFGVPQDNPFIANIWKERDYEINWAAVLEGVNDWCDRFVHMVHLPHAQRADMLSQITKEIESLNAQANELSAKQLGAMSVQQRTKVFTDHMISTFPFVLEVIIRRDGFQKARHTLMQIAEKLAAHRLSHSEYPGVLDDVQGYQPVDPAGSLRYERRGTGYVLYNVGHNGEDDSGSDFTRQIRRGEYVDEEIDDLLLDDIVIRVPVLPLQLP